MRCILAVPCVPLACRLTRTDLGGNPHRCKTKHMCAALPEWGPCARAAPRASPSPCASPFPWGQQDGTLLQVSQPPHNASRGPSSLILPLPPLFPIPYLVCINQLHCFNQSISKTSSSGCSWFSGAACRVWERWCWAAVGSCARPTTAANPLGGSWGSSRAAAGLREGAGELGRWKEKRQCCSGMGLPSPGPIHTSPLLLNLGCIGQNYFHTLQNRIFEGRPSHLPTPRLKKLGSSPILQTPNTFPSWIHLMLLPSTRAGWAMLWAPRFCARRWAAEPQFPGLQSQPR